MKNVVVTGADGFIGSHLTEALLNEGCSVTALAQYNSFNNWGWLEGNVHPQLEVVCGDVRDAAFCRHISKGVDTVFHLAFDHGSLFGNNTGGCVSVSYSGNFQL